MTISLFSKPPVVSPFTTSPLPPDFSPVDELLEPLSFTSADGPCAAWFVEFGEAGGEGRVPPHPSEPRTRITVAHAPATPSLAEDPRPLAQVVAGAPWRTHRPPPAGAGSVVNRCRRGRRAVRPRPAQQSPHRIAGLSSDIRN